MLTPVDAKNYEALVRLSKTADGSVLAKLLATELQTVLDTLMSAETEQVPRLQGRAQLLKELTQLLKGS